MKSIKFRSSADFEAFRMYREDLDALVHEFRDSTASLVLTDRQYEYENLDEMQATIGTKVSVLEIRSSDPDVWLILDKNGNHLLTVDPTDPRADSLFLRLSGFLRQRHKSQFPTWTFTAVSLVVGQPQRL